MKYFDEISKSMKFLSGNNKTIFLGQAVSFPGTAMTSTLKDVPKEKLIELPVFEEMQMGMSIGFALEGKIPISIYPRWNFLLLAVNQLVNHLDKIPKMSNNGFIPKVIIRTGVGAERPLHPQFQHTGDFSEAFKKMLTNIEVIKLNEPDDIFPAYEKAFTRTDGRNTIIVEFGDYYNEK